MPCAAPCNRLLCDERCTKLLPCGHQCPSICGEDCPVDYCQECGMKSEQSPNIILSTLYRDIDINESPIVVLGCGHFWTIETLDGHVGLKDVYKMDPRTGGFNALFCTPNLSPNMRCKPRAPCMVAWIIRQPISPPLHVYKLRLRASQSRGRHFTIHLITHFVSCSQLLTQIDIRCTYPLLGQQPVTPHSAIFASRIRSHPAAIRSGGSHCWWNSQ
jgi:hypothetical protein